MPKVPAFQFYPADYLADADVALMTLEEEGCYIRLLAYCWREGSIPSSDKELSRLCKNAPARTIRAVKRRFERKRTDAQRIIHKRLDGEREKQEKFREGRRLAGVESGKSRRLKALSDEHMLDSVRTKGEQNRTLLSSSSSSDYTPSPTPPTDAGGEIIVQWQGEAILVKMGKHKRLFTQREIDSMAGLHAKYFLERIKAKGFEARILDKEPA